MGLVEIDQLTPAQAEDLLELYRREWWTKDRQLADVRRMLHEADLVFGLCDEETGGLVAFARAVSDGAYKALIFDVIVASRFRAAGVGRRLVERVLDHPDVQRGEHVELYCLPEMIPFYERLGFSADVGGVVLMRRSRDETIS